MNKTPMISLDALTRDELEQIAVRMECRNAGCEPADTQKMTRKALVCYIESLKKPYRGLPKRPRVRKERMPKNLGVGKYCRELLARVIEEGPEGPVGFSYNKMVDMVQKKFPQSAVDDRHLRWYAAQMRRDDKKIPNNRKRSRWI